MTKRLTEQRLMNITLFYLSRYESSTEKVRAMLNRRLRRMQLQGEEVPPEATDWIESVIQKVQRESYLDDNRYAENQVRVLVGQGRSEHFITAKLSLAGITAEQVRGILNDMGSTEQSRAMRFVERKKIGFYRPSSLRQQFWEKDMAALARAGFSYDIARQALTGESEE